MKLPPPRFDLDGGIGQPGHAVCGARSEERQIRDEVRATLSSVERTAWTDERIDDLADRMDAGFARMDRNFERVDRDIRDLRSELRFEVGALRLTLIRVGGGIMAGLVGVIAAVLLGS